jgi:hypothetical protein
MVTNRRDKLDQSNPLSSRKQRQNAAGITHDDLANRMLYGSDGALVVTDDGIEIAGKFSVSKVGVHWRGDLSLNEYKAMFGFIESIEHAYQWIIGDWLGYGETKKWGETYQQLVEETGKKIETLYDYAYVASNVQISVRTEKLTFGHHKLVAAMTPEEQQRWLQSAVDNDFSVRQLRAAINNEQPPTLPSRMDRLSNEYTRISKKFASLLDGAGRGERAQMADMLEDLARKIRSGDL